MFKVYDDFLTYRAQLLSLVGWMELRLETGKLLLFDRNQNDFFWPLSPLTWLNKALQILADIGMYLLFIAYFEKGH